MILPRRASDPAPSRRHRPRTCAIAILSLIAAWLLPAFHAIVPHAHPSGHAAIAPASHQAGCCGHRPHAHPPTTPEQADAACQNALARSDTKPKQQTPSPTHDPRDCDLCQLIALGLHRPTPIVNGVDIVEPLAVRGTVEPIATLASPTRAVAAAHARGPPAA